MKNWFLRNYPLLIVIAAPIILFIGPIIRGRVIFWGTPVMQFLPWQTEAFQQLKQGIIPLWNPLNGMGAPLLANYQTAIFYPVNWIMFAIYTMGGVRALANGQTLSIVFHLAWAGCGMVLLARKLGLGKPAQTVTGICFTLCGFLVPRVSFFPIIWAVSWMTWIIYAATFIYTAKGSSRAIDLKTSLGKLLLLVLFITFLLFAGHAQMAWYIILFTGIFVLATGWKTHGFMAGLSGLGIFVTCVVFAASIASIQLLPTFEYLLESQRAGAVNYEAAVTYSFWPWHFLTLLAPGMFGSPVVGNYWGYGNYWEDAIYFGVMPFFLSLGTLTTFFKKKTSDENPFRFLVFFYWITIAAAILLALGKNFYLFPFLYKYAPTFALFQSPSRFMILAEFSLCLLAGIQVEKLTPPLKKRLYWTRLGTMGAFAVALGAILALIYIPGIKSTLIRGFAWFGVFALVTGLLVLFKRKTGKPQWIWNVLLLGFITIDLLAANWNFNPTISASFFPAEMPKNTSNQLNKRVYMSFTDEYTIKYNWLFQFVSFQPNVDWQTIYMTNLADANLYTQIPVVNNYDPFVPGRYSIWMNYLDTLNEKDLSQVLQLMNVGQVEKAVSSTPRGLATRQISGGMPYKMFYCGVSAADSENALSLTKDLINSDSILDRVVVETQNNIPTNDCSQSGKWEINLESNLPNQIGLYVTSAKDGYLFIANTWYPGWAAYVDGKTVPIIRADFNFMAISLIGGDHMVEFKYTPLSFLIGVGVTTVAIFAFITLFIVNKRVINKKP